MRLVLGYVFLGVSFIFLVVTLLAYAAVLGSPILGHLSFAVGIGAMLCGLILTRKLYRLPQRQFVLIVSVAIIVTELIAAFLTLWGQRK